LNSEIQLAGEPHCETRGNVTVLKKKTLKTLFSKKELWATNKPIRLVAGDYLDT
jgi:hypothetical protein